MWEQRELSPFSHHSSPRALPRDKPGAQESVPEGLGQGGWAVGGGAARRKELTAGHWPGRQGEGWACGGPPSTSAGRGVLAGAVGLVTHRGWGSLHWMSGGTQSLGTSSPEGSLHEHGGLSLVGQILPTWGSCHSWLQAPGHLV